MARSRVTPQSLMTMSNPEIIQAIYETVVVDIPERVDPENFEIMSTLLGKLPNDYSYVISLLGYARNFTRQLKRAQDKEMYEDMMDKTKALDDISSAIKLKYQAVSRMISLYEVQMEYNEMHGYRKGR